MPANPQHQYSLIPKEAASQDHDDNRNSIENSSSVYDSPLVRKSSALGKRTKLVVIQIDNAIQDAYRYQVREVDYNFNSTNPFKGAPIADIEEEWTRLMNGAHTLRVQEADMKKMNMSSIQMSDGSGDYLAVPISYHMLHCLYNIYRYNHPEFYGEDKGGPDWIVKHTDHCIDNLRQFVQCHVGTGFETWKWLETRKLPWPVVSTEEICVDWTYFDSRVRAQSIPAVDMRTMRNGKLLSHPKYGPVYEEDYYNHTLAA